MWTLFRQIKNTQKAETDFQDGIFLKFPIVFEFARLFISHYILNCHFVFASNALLISENVIKTAGIMLNPIKMQRIHKVMQADR